MAAASPTPMSSTNAQILTRRTSQRQALRKLPSRSGINRSESNPAGSIPNAQTRQYVNDSSDDEIPVPMKLSALTKALLNNGEPEAGGVVPNTAAAALRGSAPPPSPLKTHRRSVLSSSTSSTMEDRRQLRSGSAQTHDTRSSRAPSEGRDTSPAPKKRIVKLSTTPRSLNQMNNRRSTSQPRPVIQRKPSINRPASRGESREKSAEPSSSRDRRAVATTGASASADVNTPAQQPRVVRILTGSGVKARSGGGGASSAVSSAGGSASQSDADAALEEPGTAVRNSGSIASVSRPASGLGSRNDDNAGLQSSMRVKRVGKVAGAFLSGPARRGKRRQSEEDEEEGGNNGDGENMASSQRPESDRMAPSFYGNQHADFNSGSPVSSKDLHRRQVSASTKPSPRDESPIEGIPNRTPHVRPIMPSTHDQENEIPSRFKRPLDPISINPAADKVPKPPLGVDASSIRRTASPERKPLAALSHNTPHRPAPPPPKMLVADVATTTAGAATVKQRRNVLKVNGKCYTRLDVLGRGGAGKVYRVTAENGKMMALKRVSLENADANMVKCFKSEIDLLRKLANVERVISLFDYEMNDEKKVLILVMEIGEVDFDKFFKARQPPEKGCFDPVFVRFYWKEMLECLQAVHEHDVVHSDLKPANFVLVNARLKLIDFGIANAIQTDETVHVHRETQVGTPNYMSPESLMDYNALRGIRIPGQPKLVKLGKPSDVWSLGCILYQMVYGLAPFAHIPNPMGRCQAIINWDYAIEFPSRGMGGVPVPPSLLRTMRRCLTREQHLRPSCEELLHPTDPFLFPVEMHDRAMPIDEELLGRIIQSVVQRCRERMPTEAECMSVWPAAYWGSVKKAMNANRT